PHLVFLDVKMQGMDGLETLRKLRELDAHAQVVMISGHGTIQTAVEATQLGAYDFLEKPLDTDRILLTLRNALQHVDLESENVRLKAEVHAQYEIVGSSKAIKQVIERIEKVAPTQARVLITGENGAGKELVARAIHALSPRGGGVSRRPALSPERGADRGAAAPRPARRHSPARPALRGAADAARRAPAQAPRQGGCTAARGPRLAGQHPRAAQRGGATPHPRVRTRGAGGGGRPAGWHGDGGGRTRDSDRGSRGGAVGAGRHVRRVQAGSREVLSAGGAQ